MTRSIPQSPRPVEPEPIESPETREAGLQTRADMAASTARTGLPDEPQTLKTFTIDVDEAWMLP